MINFYLYKFGEFLAGSFPLKIAYALAIFFSDCRFLVADQDKKFVLANLQAIFPEKKLAEIKAIRRRMFRNFAKYLVDFFRSPGNSPAYLDAIEVTGLEHYNAALAKGKGIIVLTAHIGNWELGGQVIASHGYEFWVVALPHLDKKVNRFFDARREKSGMQVIPFGKAARQCLYQLKQNRLVGLLGDRDFSKERGILVDFLGRKTFLPKGPAALAIATGAPIIPGFMIRHPDDSFTMMIEPPIEAGPGKKPSDENDLKEVVNRYKTVIETYIKRYPDQWFMFRQFWAQ